MRIAVFDCPRGIAGDMVVGAMLDAGLPLDLLKEQIAKLDLEDYRLQCKSVKAGSFRAKKFSVLMKAGKKRAHTPLKDIEKRIRGCALAGKIKESAIAMFRCLGRAEAHVHGIALSKVHFHEAGAVDSMIDIVSTAVAFDYFKIRKAYVRKVVIGRGLQRGAHGRMPVPVPGAYELLKGFSLTQSDHEGEMVTPTGAAILKAQCRRTAKIPAMRLESIGYGAGDRKIEGVRGFVRISLAKAS